MSKREFKLKQISYGGETVNVLLQSTNGPCGFLALVNALILSRRLKQSESLIARFDNLVHEVANLLLDMNVMTSQPFDMDSILSQLSRLDEGLILNPLFSDCQTFRNSNTEIFSLLKIPLFHGWVVDEGEAYAILKDKSFDSCQDILARLDDLTHLTRSSGSTEDSHTLVDGPKIYSWLQANQSQLTYAGLFQIHERLPDGEVGVLFRANHFSTIVKHNGSIYSLVTDESFGNLIEVVWERLDDTCGDTEYYPENFVRVFVNDMVSGSVSPKDCCCRIC